MEPNAISNIEKRRSFCSHWRTASRAERDSIAANWNRTPANRTGSYLWPRSGEGGGVFPFRGRAHHSSFDFDEGERGGVESGSRAPNPQKLPHQKENICPLNFTIFSDLMLLTRIGKNPCPQIGGFREFVVNGRPNTRPFSFNLLEGVLLTWASPNILENNKKSR